MAENEREQLLHDVQSLLVYHQAMGMKEVPVQDPEARIQKPEVFLNSGSCIPARPAGGLDPEEKAKALEQLNKSEVLNCTKCRLCQSRTQTVFGVGNPHARLMFVGEGPGRDEDAQGEPFVGRAGQLLNKIITAMGLKRSDVYIGNIVKCRPPNNRQPAPDEMQTCLPYLRRQIEIIGPKIIVCLGATAVQGLLQTEEKISRLRGTFIDWDGITVMPTYHPAFLLRNPDMKKPVWEDMKKVMQRLTEGS